MSVFIPNMITCNVISYTDIVPYKVALSEQIRIYDELRVNKNTDSLLLLEHSPTITLGRGSKISDLLTDASQLSKEGIEIVEVDRGGEITYHAPGQLVGYIILDLNKRTKDLHLFLRNIEEVIILTLKDLDIVGNRIPGLTGVWVNDNKVAAIGVKCRQWVTMHGFAINYAADLTPMRRDIVPCGIRDRGVTSIEEIKGDQSVTRELLEASIIKNFHIIFGYDNINRIVY